MNKDAAKLIEAVQSGDMKQLMSLLNKGVDPNLREDHGWTPLHWAAQEGNDRVVKSLIRAGAIVDALDNQGFSALILAIGEGHAGTVCLLIANGANVNQKCEAHQSGTPLHHACAWNRLEIAKILISYGADVNAVDSAGRTPLYFAVMYGAKQIIKLLITHEAIVDSDKRDSEENKTILDLALDAKDTSIIDLLKSAGGKVRGHPK